MSVAEELTSGACSVGLPSRKISASYFPGPQLVSTLLSVGTSTPSSVATGWRLGASETMAPTFRSRFGHPSRRLPMPGANELSTVERQRAQGMPNDLMPPAPYEDALTPTTASRSRSARVVAGAFRSTFPALMSARSDAGRASASTLSPTERAVVGSTVPLALWR